MTPLGQYIHSAAAARVMAQAVEPEPTTARGIIEKRLGRKLPPTAELAPDLRVAVKRLAIQLIRRKAAE